MFKNQATKEVIYRKCWFLATIFSLLYILVIFFNESMYFIDYHYLHLLAFPIFALLIFSTPSFSARGAILTVLLILILIRINNFLLFPNAEIIPKIGHPQKDQINFFLGAALYIFSIAWVVKKIKELISKK